MKTIPIEIYQANSGLHAQIPKSLIHHMRAGLLQLPALPPLSLYVHLPWCLKKCPYCDFNSHEVPNFFATSTIQTTTFQQPQSSQSSWLSVDLENEYIDALIADLEVSLPLIWGRTVHSIFIGGGTPSLFSPTGIGRLLDALRSRLHLQPDCEITMEANPGTFEKHRFKAFKTAGVTRLSIGVQSFNDLHLQALGRVHSAQQATDAIHEAKEHFETFNVDLMYALPKQTLEQLKQDLSHLLQLQPPHVSIYHLTVEPNTVFAKYPPNLPEEDTAYAMLDVLTEQLTAAGLMRYEVSAYAKKGHGCWHNKNYWQFGDYLGVGAGAHSKLSFAHRVVRQVCYRSPQLYMQNAMLGNAIAQDDDVKYAELPFEFMLGALRLKNGFNTDTFFERTGHTLVSIKAVVMQAIEKGWLVHNQNQKHIYPTDKGMDFLSDLQELFL